MRKSYLLKTIFEFNHTDSGLSTENWSDVIDRGSDLSVMNEASFPASKDPSSSSLKLANAAQEVTALSDCSKVRASSAFVVVIDIADHGSHFSTGHDVPRLKILF